MPKPGLENLTSATLKDAVADLRAIGITQQSALELGLAQVIIINSLSGEFWAKECIKSEKTQPFFLEKSDVRVTHIANMLWCLKDCIGFKEFVSKNDKNNFESTYYECIAAYLFLKNSSNIELVIPIQERGKDFDIRVIGFHLGHNFNVEVKARRQQFHNEKQVLNFLGSHRSQLPPDGNGVIFCKLELGEGMIDQASLIQTTRKFIAGTNRVKFVVYCWDFSQVENAIGIMNFAVDSEGMVDMFFPSVKHATVPVFLSEAGISPN